VPFLAVVPVVTGHGVRRRLEVAQNVARDHRVPISEALRWCDAWEEYAAHEAIERDAYFWDSAQGWIDAQLILPTTERKRGHRARSRR
jgi:hypothetical protein